MKRIILMTVLSLLSFMSFGQYCSPATDFTAITPTTTPQNTAVYSMSFE